MTFWLWPGTGFDMSGSGGNPGGKSIGPNRAEEHKALPPLEAWDPGVRSRASAWWGPGATPRLGYGEQRPGSPEVLRELKP